MLGPIPAVFEAGGVIPRTSHKFIAGQHLKTNNHSHSLLWPVESSVFTSCMFLNCDRKPQYPERVHAGELNSTQKGPRPVDHTCDLLAVMRQYQPLHHHVTLVSIHLLIFFFLILLVVLDHKNSYPYPYFKKH